MSNEKTQKNIAKKLEQRQALIQALDSKSYPVKRGWDGGIPWCIPTGLSSLDIISARDKNGIYGWPGGSMIVLMGDPKSGKCVDFHTQILTSDGSLCSIGKLVESNSTFGATTIDRKLAFTSTQHSKAIPDGTREVLLVKTKDGRNLKATPEHKVLTISGWKKVADLSCDDYIATPRSIPVFGQDKLPHHIIKLLAYFIGDGGLTTPTPMFTKANTDVIDEFKECIFKAGSNCSLAEQRGPTTHLRVICRFPSKINPVKEMLKIHGLMGKLSIHKTIPNAIFKLPKNQLALFLNRLFATDGWASGEEIGYCTGSETMARQLQHLLLRFGVWIRLSTKVVAITGGNRTYWVLTCTQAASIEIFAKEIGIFSKEKQLQKVLDCIRAKYRRENTDTIPMPWTSILAKTGGRAALAKRLGVPSRKVRSDRPTATKEMALMVAKEIADPWLESAVSGDFWWNRVISIDPAGVAEVFDIQTDVENFLANDLIIHNSTTAMTALANAQKPDPLNRRPPMICYYIETEGGLTTREYMERQGIDVDDILYDTPDTLEEAFEGIRAKLSVIAAKPPDQRIPMFIILDSISNVPTEEEDLLPTKKDKDGKTAKGSKMGHARVNSEKIRQLTPLIRKTQSIVCVIAQAKVDIQWGGYSRPGFEKKTFLGARPILFYSSLVYTVSRGARIKDEKENDIGMIVYMRADMSKVGIPYGKAGDLELYFDRGFDWKISLHDALLAKGLIAPGAARTVNANRFKFQLRLKEGQEISYHQREGIREVDDASLEMMKQALYLPDAKIEALKVTAE